MVIHADGDLQTDRQSGIIVRVVVPRSMADVARAGLRRAAFSQPPPCEPRGEPIDPPASLSPSARSSRVSPERAPHRSRRWSRRRCLGRPSSAPALESASSVSPRAPPRSTTRGRDRPPRARCARASRARLAASASADAPTPPDALGRVHLAPPFRSLLGQGPRRDDARPRGDRPRQVRRRRGVRTAAGPRGDPRRPGRDVPRRRPAQVDPRGGTQTKRSEAKRIPRRRVYPLLSLLLTFLSGSVLWTPTTGP